MSYFPMMVNLEGVRVLVIGGGEERRKKVEILSLFGAKKGLVCIHAFLSKIVNIDIDYNSFVS